MLAAKTGFMFHLGVLLKRKSEARSAPAQCGTAGAHVGLSALRASIEEPVAEEILQEINGYTVATRELVPGFTRAEGGWLDGVRLLDLFRRVSESGARIARTNARPRIFMATDGDSRGHPTAELFTIAPRRGRMESRGANERN